MQCSELLPVVVLRMFQSGSFEISIQDPELVAGPLARGPASKPSATSVGYFAVMGGGLQHLPRQTCALISLI